MPSQGITAKNVDTQVTAQVEVTQAAVDTVIFLFNSSTVVVPVAFKDANGVTRSEEVWIAQGPLYVQLMGQASKVGSNLEVIEDIVEKGIAYIENNPATKARLIADGELNIRRGIQMEFL